jgi:predicted phosphodiesterase
MRIGIVTDIHDEVEKLVVALATLRAVGADAIVSLGDTTDLFGSWDRADEVAGLLRGAGVVGVWGNHDHGLCRGVGEKARARASAASLDYMATFRGRLELGGCHFSHVDPWIDPDDPANLWAFDGRPEDPDRLERSFATVANRVAFLGHYHRWVAATERGLLAWEGDAPLPFDAAERYLVVIGPLFRGDFAVFDTDAAVLTPFRC